MTTAGITVRFWGVRGSIPVSGASTCGAGGDTSCVEIRCGDHEFLFDAGSGIRKAGETLAKEGLRTCDLFLSHSHYDHIIGLPFFSPLLSPELNFSLWSAKLDGGLSSEETAASLMRAPFFPVTPHVFKASMAYRDFIPGDTLQPRSGISIRTARLAHPGGVVAYRIEYKGRTAVYMTDTSHGDRSSDSAAQSLADGADLLIYDCMYTDDEFAGHGGYGHSTWQQGVRICQSAGVPRLALFHHAPDRSDDGLARIEGEARAVLPQAFAARQGMTISI
jgi:phosphoribosyl 1,2-cyclic phosphodiesterase